MQIRYDFFCNFLLLSSGPDTTYQQILLKFLLFETSSINSTRLFNFAEKERFFLRHRVMVLTFTINSSVEIRFNFRGNFELLCLRLLWSSPSGFDACFGLRHILLASLCASAGAISIGCLWMRLHRARAPALAAGERLNWARTGNLQQQPCQGSSAVNQSCCTFLYILWLQ